MMPDPIPDMLTQALEAYDAGLCVVKARADGAKRPFGAWRQYQAERPSRDQVIEWFRDGWPAMGTICGAVSGDLEMFELEGRFVTEITTGAFAKAMMAAGLGDLLKRLRGGIVAVSPSGGRHFLYHVDGPVDGNTKLAMRDATDDELLTDPQDRYKVLIETRGEGGFVMLAPSHGTAHPSGKAWKISEGGYSTIPTITLAEREALFEVARSFHTASPQPVTPPTPSGKTLAIPRASKADERSWFDAAVDHVKSTVDMRGLLEHYGWTYLYTDRRGRDMFKRPGKDTDGVSASINESGRLLVFSSAAGFKSYVSPKVPTPTYDQLDVIAYYDHHNRREDAAKAVAEQTGIFEARDKAKLDALAPFMPVQVATPTPNVDAETGEIATPADDSIWSERWYLEHIRDAARSRMVAPYAVFGCVVARVAAFTPPSTCLPPTIGGRAPLSLYIALHGASGAGKSSPVACASDLIPEVPVGCVGPLGLGSGEGLVEAYMDLVEDTDDQGKKRKIKRQVYRGALFTLDEGQMLAEIGSRKGSTILPVLRTAWSGDDPGQANASIETRRSLRKGNYHIGLISLWQDKAGAALIEDADGGTPQRFIWLPTTDPAFPDVEPEWPGEIDMVWPATIAIGGLAQPNPMGLAQEIRDEIKESRRAIIRGHRKEAPLDAHRRLNKLKLSGVLALLDGRTSIGVDDWRIAEHFMCVSDAVRDMVLDKSRQRLAEQIQTDAKRYALREVVAQDATAQRALERAARAAWKTAERADTAVTRRQIHSGIASRDRQMVTADEAVAEAVRLSWLTPDGDGWVVGKARPA